MGKAIRRDHAMIWKEVLPWPLPADGLIELAIPCGARVLSFADQVDPLDADGDKVTPDLPAIWFLFDRLVVVRETRRFVVQGTGQSFSPGPGALRFIGSAPIRRLHAVYVVHLFEVIDATIEEGADVQ